MEAREELKKLRESTCMYLLRLMAYKVEMERLSDKSNNNDRRDEPTNK